MKIGGTEIGSAHPCYVVAEIGISHNGNLDTAKEMIREAKNAGADAVKFQKRTIDVVYTEEELARPRESVFGSTNGDLKRGLEFGFTEYSEINMYCNEKGITWFASPWDVHSVEFLEVFDIPAYKVASACVTDEDLLSVIKETKKPVIMSTGMSTEDQIWTAHDVIMNGPLAFLVCTSTYPCKLEELNLNRISTLNDQFTDCEIGYSNHYPGPWPSLCAVALGACIIECHVTLSRSMWGSDQAASLEFTAFAKMIREIRDFEIAKGSGDLGILQSEITIMEKLRRFR